MIRLYNALKADIKFQSRQGFYLIYFILSVIYIAVIYQTGYKTAVILIPILIYFDPAMVGFMFTGGLIMLEKQQGVTSYIGITPVKTYEYLLAKMLSMTLLALGAATLISISAWKPFNPILLVIGVSLVSIFHTLLGLLVSVNCKSMNDYFIRMLPYMLVIVTPVLGFLNNPWTEIFKLFPGFAGLRLILCAYPNGIEMHALQDISIMVFWIVVISIPTSLIFDKKVIRG